MGSIVVGWASVNHGNIYNKSHLSHDENISRAGTANMDTVKVGWWNDWKY